MKKDESLRTAQAKRTVTNVLSVVTVLLLNILFAGCSEDLSEIDVVSSESQTDVAYRISKEDAIEIAANVLKNSSTRSRTFSTPTFEYVLNDCHSRSTILPDTLAYVLNYPNDEGFAIIATDRRVNPVLAYSDEGSFGFDNESAKENFIDNIEAYMEAAVSDANFDILQPVIDQSFVKGPMVQILLNQRAPWNKYVIEEYPGCPVGCVAVATALVMSHSKDVLEYHNSTYYFKSIINAIKAHQYPEEYDDESGDSDDYPAYTYEQAVDSMARILYWIGKDVDMDYKPDGSYAYHYKARKLVENLGYNVSSGLLTFDIEKVANLILNNHLIYLAGTNQNNVGHAWVSDGCNVTVDPDNIFHYRVCYIHCDWGWGGYCNGYFSGSVFEIPGRKYTPTSYYAVKIED